MDFQLLIEHLPQLFDQWGTSQLQPISAQFQPLVEEIGGTTTTTVMQVLHTAIATMPADEVYCEVGCLWGANLIAALQGNPERMAYAIESPQRLGSNGEISDRLLQNLTRFNLQDQVYFCAQETDEFFADLREAGLSDRIGVFFYNGTSDYRSVFLSLLLAQPFLAEKALIILGQAELGMVRQAASDFLSTYSQASLLLDLSDQGEQPGFGQGLLLLGWDAAKCSVETAFNPLQPEATDNAFALLEQHQQAISLENLRSGAFQLAVEGRLDEAEKKYETYLLYQSVNSEVWQSLGMVRYLAGKDSEALDALSLAIQLNPYSEASYQTMGLLLERLEKPGEAIQAYRQGIQLNPGYVDALSKLGELLMRQGDLAEAETTFRQAIAVAPELCTNYMNLGDALVKQGQAEAAIAEYRQAMELNTQDLNIWAKLAEAYHAIGDSKRENLCIIYSLYHQNRHQEAISQFEAHFSLADLKTNEQCLLLCDCYCLCGFTEQAIQCAERAAQLAPHDPFLQIAPYLVLPLLYRTTGEIDYYRQRYLKAYSILQQWLEQVLRQEKEIDLQTIERFPVFYISYQGLNNVEVHRTYGRLRHLLAAARHPEMVKPLPMPPRTATGKIRIGYIAEALGDNSETRWALGWLKNHDRSQFEIYCYSLDAAANSKAMQFKVLSDVFRQLPNDLNTIIEQIQADQPHVLVFLSTAGKTKVEAIASLRLAPVQCAAWGHPVTSGIPTVDYFLSSELMEPENGQEHYTEKLIRLPNIGLCYPEPHFPKPTKNRADFGLRDDSVIYLSCQLLFKYLPQHDYLFAEIARQVPNAQIVFILRSTKFSGFNPNLEPMFRQRLERVFADVGLQMEDYCVFLPGQNLEGYASILTCADVFLDTLAFSGGHTTLEAVAANLPVVCCPGELMRGRQSSGILHLLGVTETIAETEADYINIAARLGLDPDWRQAIVQRMSENQSKVFEDKACVLGLEQFYRQVTQLI